MARIETENEVRQGPPGKPVLYVLIGALALAAVYLVGTMIWAGSTAPPDPERGTVTTPSAPATPPAGEQRKPQ